MLLVDTVESEYILLNLILSEHPAPWYSWEAKTATLLLHLHLQPGAKRTEISGRYGNSLKIRLAAPPVEGKANQALIAYLAKTLGVTRHQVEIIRGELSREKTVRISDYQALLRRLSPT